MVLLLSLTMTTNYYVIIVCVEINVTLAAFSMVRLLKVAAARVIICADVPFMYTAPAALKKVPELVKSPKIL